jgi:diadenosine tetraphosphate (Ap4A) HIT family hydrolase
MTDCELCGASEETVVWQDASCRVILVADSDYPAFCRVIWHAHAKEMSALSRTEQRHLLNVVLATEAALLRLVPADKINLASLGNVVPHLHWHVIARCAADKHFPQPVWGQPQRAGTPLPAPARTDLHDAIRDALAELTSG